MCSYKPIYVDNQHAGYNAIRQYSLTLLYIQIT